AAGTRPTGVSAGTTLRVRPRLAPYLPPAEEEPVAQGVPGDDRGGVAAGVLGRQGNPVEAMAGGPVSCLHGDLLGATPRHRGAGPVPRLRQPAPPACPGLHGLLAPPPRRPCHRARNH